MSCFYIMHPSKEKETRERNLPKLTLGSYNLLKIIDTIKNTCIKAIENKGTTVKTFLAWLRRTNDY